MSEAADHNYDAVHLSHCNQGLWCGSCKYGDPECPAMDFPPVNCDDEDED